jgi:hypothetical protein
LGENADGFEDLREDPKPLRELLVSFAQGERVPFS